MEEAQVVTVLQRPTLKPLQIKHSSNGHLNDNGGHTYNSKDQIHNANVLKTNSVRNIDGAEFSPNCTEIAECSYSGRPNCNKLAECSYSDRPNCNKLAKCSCAGRPNCNKLAECSCAGRPNCNKLAECPCAVRPNCKNYNNKRNKNKTLRRSRRTQSADEESPSTMQPKEQNETESEESRSIGNVESEKDENLNRVQRDCIGCKDIVILNTEEDIEAVSELRKQLLDLDIPELTVDIFDNIHLGKNEMESIRLVSQQYKTVLVYKTHNFYKNRMRCNHADILYLYALETNQQQVIPVWAENSLPRFTGIKGIQLSKNMSVFSEQVKGLVLAGRAQLVF